VCACLATFVVHLILHDFYHCNIHSHVHLFHTFNFLWVHFKFKNISFHCYVSGPTEIAFNVLCEW
jgi:hypothetical protein